MVRTGRRVRWRDLASTRRCSSDAGTFKSMRAQSSTFTLLRQARNECGRRRAPQAGPEQAGGMLRYPPGARARIPAIKRSEVGLAGDWVLRMCGHLLCVRAVRIGAPLRLLPGRVGGELRARDSGRSRAHSVFCQLGSLVQAQPRRVASAAFFLKTYAVWLFLIWERVGIAPYEVSLISPGVQARPLEISMFQALHGERK